MRTKIIRDRNVEDYIKVLEGDVRLQAACVRDLVEDGNLVVCDDFVLDCDYEFLHSLTFPATESHAVKKAKGRHLLVPLEAARYHEHVLFNLFPGDIETAGRYQQQIIKVTEQMDAIFRSMYPDAVIVDPNVWTWRFTRTENEELHWDVYGQTNLEAVRVRMFVNIDDQPRIWHVTHKSTTAMRMFKNVWDPSMHPNEINRALTSRAPVATLPCHRIEFAPGAFWMGDSQLIGHQIVYGNKLLAYTYLLDHTKGVNLDKTFNERARRAALDLSK